MTSFAFVFPGQGSQAVGMLDAWADHPAVRETLAEASAALGEDIGALIHAGPKEQLDLTTNTQPVMLTAGVACYRAWLAEGGAAPCRRRRVRPTGRDGRGRDAPPLRLPPGFPPRGTRVPAHRRGRAG